MTNILPLVDELGLDTEPLIGAQVIIIYHTDAGFAPSQSGEVLSIKRGRLLTKATNSNTIYEWKRERKTNQPILPNFDDNRWRLIGQNGKKIKAKSNGKYFDYRSLFYFKNDPLVKFLSNGL